MKHLTDLFKLMQITRAQPQYGYALSGISKHELSDLAQHHYLVTFIAWQLARNANDAGAKLNVERVLEIALVHDLGELFGGDLSYYYSKANPEARKTAKELEAKNCAFLSDFFGNQKEYFTSLVTEANKMETDEALIAKMADYIECVHYKHGLNKMSSHDMEANGKDILRFAEKMSDSIAKRELTSFAHDWAENLAKGTIIDLLWQMKK